MKLSGEGVLVRIFVGESDRWHGKPLYEAIVLRVRPTEVPLLLSAMSEGRIDLVGVPRQQEVPLRTADEGAAG